MVLTKTSDNHANAHSIISLAILKANWDEKQKDYIENFIPFVRQILSVTENDPITPAFLQQQLGERFGLLVPQQSALLILRRAVKGHRLLTVESHQFFRTDHTAIGSAGFEGKVAEASRRHNAVLSKLSAFCLEKYDVHWTSEETDEALAAYLDAFSLECLSAATRGTVIPAPVSSPRNASFLVNSFISSIQSSDPQSFDYFTTVVKASMLANAMYCPDLGSLEKKFRCTTFFLDTTFLLRLLGYEGKEAQAPCKELASLLIAENGQLAVFEKTLQEVHGVLVACAYALEGLRRDPSFHSHVLDHLVELGYKSSDVLLAISKMEDVLAEERIMQMSWPRFTSDYQIDESELARHLQEKVGYRKEAARDHDVACISAVFRLREGKDPSSIEETKAVFVTTNTTMAQAIIEFTRMGEYPRKCPVCVGDHDLTNLVWLKRPMAAPDLPVKQVIANCYAALEPSPELWDHYVDEADKLLASGQIDARSHAQLRYSLRAREELMCLTQGDAHDFRPGNVKHILALLKEEHEIEVKNAVLEARSEVVAATAEAEAVIAKQLDGLRRRRSIAKRWAKVVGNTAFIFAALILSVGAILTIRALAGTVKWVHSWWFVLAQAFIVVGGLLSLVYGTSVSKLVIRLEAWLFRRMLSALNRLAGG